MSVQTFDELYTHAGHDVQVSQYYNINAVVVNVAIECMECHEVLIDFDKE